MASPLGLIQWAFNNAPALAANVAVLGTFGAIVTAGIMKGIKEFRDFKKPAAAAPSVNAQIAAATILENVTLNEWSRSNREATVAINRLCDMLASHHDETANLRRNVEDVSHWLKTRGV